MWKPSAFLSLRATPLFQEWRLGAGDWEHVSPPRHARAYLSALCRAAMSTRLMTCDVNKTSVGSGLLRGII